VLGQLALPRVVEPLPLLLAAQPDSERRLRRWIDEQLEGGARAAQHTLGAQQGREPAAERRPRAAEDARARDGEGQPVGTRRVRGGGGEEEDGGGESRPAGWRGRGRVRSRVGGGGERVLLRQRERELRRRGGGQAAPQLPVQKKDRASLLVVPHAPALRQLVRCLDAAELIARRPLELEKRVEEARREHGGAVHLERRAALVAVVVACAAAGREGRRRAREQQLQLVQQRRAGLVELTQQPQRRRQLRQRVLDLSAAAADRAPACADRPPRRVRSSVRERRAAAAARPRHPLPMPLLGGRGARGEEPRGRLGRRGGGRRSAELVRRVGARVVRLEQLQEEGEAARGDVPALALGRVPKAGVHREDRAERGRPLAEQAR